MASLVHEIWIDPDKEGQQNNQLLFAGPDGEAARLSMGPEAKLLKTYPADSFFEAMTIYWRFWGWGEYSTDQEWDLRPYPDDMAQRQQSGTRGGEQE